LTEFNVYGPCNVPRKKRYYRWWVDIEGIKDFWTDHDSIAGSIGCYVFAMRSKSLKPLYVGLTTRSFKEECFTKHKMYHYDEALKEYSKGTPVMFFVTSAEKPTIPRCREIAQLENYLIQNGRYINPNLRNIRGGHPPSWTISGVLRGGAGKPSDGAKRFRRMMRMSSG